MIREHSRSEASPSLPARANLRRTAFQVWDWFFPPVCVACYVPVNPSREDAFCLECRRDLRVLAAPDCPCAGLFDGWEKHRSLCDFCGTLPEGFSSIRSAFPYAGVAGDAIRNLKYRGCEAAGPALAQLLLIALRPHFDELLSRKGVDLVVPVPLHRLRAWRRGFNQAERIAQPLAQMLGVEYDARTVRRSKPTARQARKASPAERLENVRDAFAVTERVRLEGRRLLLIDDVLTTGATVASCAAALRHSGAEAVHVVTVAAAGTLVSVPADPAMRGLQDEGMSISRNQL